MMPEFMFTLVKLELGVSKITSQLFHVAFIFMLKLPLILIRTLLAGLGMVVKIKLTSPEFSEPTV